MERSRSKTFHVVEGARAHAPLCSN